MEKLKIIRTIDDLVKGFNDLISSNRCSLLDHEKILLEESIKTLGELKRDLLKSSITDFIVGAQLIVKVVENVYKIFT